MALVIDQMEVVPGAAPSAAAEAAGGKEASGPSEAQLRVEMAKLLVSRRERLARLKAD